MELPEFGQNIARPFPSTGVSEVEVVTSREIQTILEATRLDDDPTDVNSEEFNAGNFREALVYLTMESTLAPTNLQFIAQFSNDGGFTWWDYLQGIWASMFYEDTILATERREAFTLPLVAGKGRIRAVATGSDATNFFDITIQIEMRP